MKRISSTDFTALAERLEQEVNADRGVDGLESVRRLYPQLQQLRTQGVPMSQLLALLREQGLHLAASTLRKYMKRIAKDLRRGPHAQSSAAAVPIATAPEHVIAAPPIISAPRPPRVLSVAGKAPLGADGGRKTVDAAPASTGHFVPAPDSERI